MKKHPLSLLGMALTTISAVLFLFVYLADAFGLHTNPYMGIVFFLIMPAFFILGLVLIPIGVFLERRRTRQGLQPHQFLKIDFNIPRHRRVVLAIITLTAVNVLIVGLAATKGIEFMDSPQFCGQVCHTVMEPEFVAYQDGPHSRVRCVDCHIGPGRLMVREIQARWHASGDRRDARTAIRARFASPVHNLRPARDTCEQCHWPEKFHGDKVNVIREYGNDEKNTESVTKLMVHIGGGSERLGVAQRHPLAHERRQPDRVRHDRRQAADDSLRQTDGPAGQRARVPHAGRDRRSNRQGGAAADGLHGLPQPAEPSILGLAGARRGRGHHARRDPARHCRSRGVRRSMF